MNEAQILALQETIGDLSYQLAELHRKIQIAGGLPGVIKTYDPATHTATVDIGYETHSVNVGDQEGLRSGLRIGQLAHLHCPGGDLASAFVVPAGYSGGVALPASDGLENVFSYGANGGVFRSRASGVAHIEAASVASLILVLGGQKFTLNPNALQPA